MVASMKLSCTDFMVPGETLKEKADRLYSWGFDGISVFADYKRWNEDKFYEIYSLYEQTGVKPCEFVFIDPVYGHLMDNDNDISKKAYDLYVQSIKVCKRIGAVTEMEYEYKYQDPIPLFTPYLKMDQQKENRFINIAKNLTKEAEGNEAYILLEPINRYESKYLNCLDDCVEIVKKIDSDNFGILADFFHMSIEEADISKSIINAGLYIKHVHIGDSNRLLPGYGHIDWKSAFKALRKVGFKGYINLECAILGEAGKELPKAAKYLINMIKG
jgi:sugar phosphate isomerase/epimerase